MIGLIVFLSFYPRLAYSYHSPGTGDGDDRQRMMAGLAGAVVMLVVELCVFVTRSLKADKALETARKVSTVSRTAYFLPMCDL